MPLFFHGFVFRFHVFVEDLIPLEMTQGFVLLGEKTLPGNRDNTRRAFSDFRVVSIRPKFVKMKTFRSLGK